QQRRQILLEGDLAIELQVARAIGDAEGALAKHRGDLVLADACTDRQSRMMLGSIGGVRRFAAIVCHLLPGTRPLAIALWQSPFGNRRSHRSTGGALVG